MTKNPWTDPDPQPGDFDAELERLGPDAFEYHDGDASATARIVVSLRGEDALRLAELAQARGKKPSDVVADLLRGTGRSAAYAGERSSSNPGAALGVEGFVVSRQGSGVFVRERTARPVALRPVVERAFQRPQVSVDFFGFTAETLIAVVQEPLDKIRAGAVAPESIAIRILVPDTSHPVALPCRVEGLADDPDFRERSHAMTRRHTQAIADAVHELDELGLVKNGTVRVHRHDLAPLFKAYILNREELFFGLYPVVRRQVALNDQAHEIYDLMGKDAVLFHHATTDDDASAGSQHVEQLQSWFDTIWTTVSRPITP